MARISDVELERLKRDVSVQALAEGRGVVFEKRGDSLVGHCCFHEDKTPSFIVTPKKNLWHCMGACRVGGSSIDFVMKAEGVSFRHAVELLRTETLAPASQRLVKESTVRRLPSPVESSADDATLLNQVVDYYQERLEANVAALEYLEKRGLGSAEMRAHFRLGFADRTLGLRLPMANRKDGEAARGRLQQLGIIRESGHEHFNGSVVVPIIDVGGVVRGLYGRKVTHGLRPGTPLHLYLPGPHKGVFNEAGLVGCRAVIICEALLDALSFWAAGFRCVTSAYGVEGFTPLHLEALKRHCVKEVLIAYDRDDAGDRGAAELAEQLRAAGIDCWRVLFPRGMDANAYACTVKPPASLAFVLSQAQWMGSDAGARPTPALRGPGASSSAASSSAASSSVASSPASVAGGAAVEVAPAPTPANTTAAVVSGEELHPPVAGDEGLDEMRFDFGARRYRVRGLKKNSTFEVLKLNLLVSSGELFHVDTLDMYSARARATFLHQAASELKVPEEPLKKDLGALLLKLEELQEQHLKNLLQPKKPEVQLTDDERATALELLKDPNLLDRILHDFEKCGVVGEETNKLVGYLAAVSRKLEEPLAVLIQSSSAAGKSSLMEAVLAFVPDEDKVKYSAMTGQSLFYMGDADLKHKVLAVVEEEGAARASYALKLLQSEGELTIASTGKNPSTGRLETHEYHVEGPTQLFLTTTASQLDEELLNRCLVLTVDEERAQTQAIHRLQREKQTLEGLLARRARETTLKMHQNAQRCLRPLLVANPFARRLTFLDDRTRARRDFPKYLTLIRALALLHQHQRLVKTVEHEGATLEYIEATLEDVATANRLATQVLGRSLDELPPQTRRLLNQVKAFVEKQSEEKKERQEDVRFTRRELREAFSAGDTQLKIHLARLVELELLEVHRLPRGGLAYALSASGPVGAPVLEGLADVDALAHGYDAERAEIGPRPVGVRSGVGPTGEKVKGLLPLAALEGPPVGVAAQAHQSKRNGASYPQTSARP